MDSSLDEKDVFTFGPWAGALAPKDDTPVKGLYMRWHCIKLFNVMHCIHLHANSVDGSRNNVNASCIFQYLAIGLSANASEWSKDIGKKSGWSSDYEDVYKAKGVNVDFYAPVDKGRKAPFDEHIRLMENLAEYIAKDNIAGEVRTVEALVENRDRVKDFWEGSIGKDAALKLGNLWAEYTARAIAAFRLAHSASWDPFCEEKQLCIRAGTAIDEFLQNL